MEACAEELRLYVVEGYAIAGLVEAVTIAACDRRRGRVVVKLTSGERLCSECLEREAAERSRKLIEFYAGLSPLLRHRPNAPPPPGAQL